MLLRFELEDVKIFGTTEASTCDGSVQCSAIEMHDVQGERCWSVIGDKFRRVGLLLPVITTLPKMGEMRGSCRTPNIPGMPCQMPWEQRLGIRSSRYAHLELKRVTMGSFRWDDCGMESVAITFNPTERNFVPPVLVSGHRWVDVEENAKYFLAPNSGHENNYIGKVRIS